MPNVTSLLHLHLCQSQHHHHHHTATTVNNEYTCNLHVSITTHYQALSDRKSGLITHKERGWTEVDQELSGHVQIAYRDIHVTAYGISQWLQGKEWHPTGFWTMTAYWVQHNNYIQYMPISKLAIIYYVCAVTAGKRLGSLYPKCAGISDKLVSKLHSTPLQQTHHYTNNSPHTTPLHTTTTSKPPIHLTLQQNSQIQPPMHGTHFNWSYFRSGLSSEFLPILWMGMVEVSEPRKSYHKQEVVFLPGWSQSEAPLQLLREAKFQQLATYHHHQRHSLHLNRCWRWVAGQLDVSK